ncbi:MAG: MBL fold metallo-hydrolase [Asgard group archaeon]|nr:MBL fold metallo-hydrolase [Asgard group archaeon]
MKIEFLGTRGNVEPSAPCHSKHSGLLVDQKYLFDIGEKVFLERKPEAIFITHLHPDHAFFVESSEKKLSYNKPIYAPEQHKKADITVLEKKISLNDHIITPIPTIHSKTVKSQAYLIEKNEKRVLYTGDLIWIEKKHHDKIKNLDAVITDGSFIRKGGLVRRGKEEGKLFGHQGIPDQIRLFDDYTDRIIFTHFGSWFYEDIEESRKKIKSLASIKLEVAYDGLIIKI